MSFPHLNQVAQLPPGISPTQFAGFPTTVLVQTAVPVVQKLTKDSIGTRNKDSEEGTGNNTGLTTTVFVGNISEKASDMLVRQLLAVSVWNLFYNFYLRSNIKSLRHITCIELVLSRNKILSSFTHSYVIEHINGKRKFKLTCLTHENQ
uniref:RRM domain-containing protein n=1 Tax=Sinocyclocheilus rhinocerous TaxID=307959 RepID=A0A673LJD1_9TELE